MLWARPHTKGNVMLTNKNKKIEKFSCKEMIYYIFLFDCFSTIFLALICICLMIIIG